MWFHTKKIRRQVCLEPDLYVATRCHAFQSSCDVAFASPVVDHPFYYYYYFFIFYFFLPFVVFPAAQFKMEKAAEGLLRNRRGVGTCVRAYVLDTRAPVYGCVHTPKNVRDRIKR